MFGRISLCFLCLFLFISCAQPKYEDGSTNNPLGQTSGNLGSSFSPQFSSSAKSVYWKWEVKPTQTQMGSFFFRVFEPAALDGFPIAIELPKDPIVVLWMPSMGHGSSPVTITKIDAATYHASNVFFIMPGEWQIKFQIKEGNVLQDETIVNITI